MTSRMRPTQQIVRFRANDPIAILMKNKYPWRVELGLPMLSSGGDCHVSAVDINVNGLTRNELVQNRFHVDEILCLLGK